MMKLFILKNNLNPIQNIVAYLYLTGIYWWCPKGLEFGNDTRREAPTNTTLIL